MNLFGKKEKTPAQTVIEDVCKIKKGEKVLIIANPETSVIAQNLFTSALDSGAKPTLIYHTKKTSADFAEETVVGAIKSEPDVIFSISEIKLGKDEKAIASPYKAADGKLYDNTFDWLLSEKKSIRAVWTPGRTEDMFNRTVNIDYKLLGERCKKLCEKYENAVSVHVTSPGGTDIVAPCRDVSGCRYLPGSRMGQRVVGNLLELGPQGKLGARMPHRIQYSTPPGVPSLVSQGCTLPTLLLAGTRLSAHDLLWGQLSAGGHAQLRRTIVTSYPQEQRTC